MRAELVWYLAIVALGGAVVADAWIGQTAAVIVALVATTLVVVAAYLDRDAGDGRPW